MAEGRWNPWRALRARPHITLEWTFLRGARGLWEPHGDGTVSIHIDPRLSQRERRCVLGHELVHDERRIGYLASTPAGLVAREEWWVWGETARRLVPPSELSGWVSRSAPLPVELWEICDEFDVTGQVARIACNELGRGREAA